MPQVYVSTISLGLVLQFERERIAMRAAMIFVVVGALAAIIVAGVLVHFMP
jgi:hypothetical protein